ncbi:MAG: hypothetical protein ACKOKC_09295 [Chthoniobacterales bacterium]
MTSDKFCAARAGPAGSVVTGETPVPLIVWGGVEKFFRIFSRENNAVNKSIVANRSSGAGSQPCSQDIHKQFTINILCKKTIDGSRASWDALRVL